MKNKISLLKKYWGYDTFRPIQEEIIDSILKGDDTLALLPTGGGKSLCYQLPALMCDGLCLVISPLIALMKDQVQQLNNKGIKAACIVSSMNAHEVQVVYNHCANNAVKLLYVSPERLQQRAFISRLKNMQLSLIAVDEAHCVSQWGYDFRPTYLKIAETRKLFPKVPLLALTATATQLVIDDIKDKLLMSRCCVFRGSFFRSNIAYSVFNEQNRSQRMLNIARFNEGTGIIYVRSRRQTQELASLLSTVGVKALAYHAGLDAKERDRRQHLWMNDDVRVMVATNAFGMGIDKPDVRWVLHMGIPDSIEAYFQESGRCGRDGRSSQAILVYDDADVERLYKNHEQSFPEPSTIRRVYAAFGNAFRVPIGSGEGASFDFDISSFASSYSFNINELFSSCQFLEREGLLAFPSIENSSSTLQIIANRNDVYRFQVENYRYGDLLQIVTRLYGGIYTQRVNIDEQRIARSSFFEAKDIAQMLLQLHAMKIVEYVPRKTKPQVVFTVARIPESNIILHESNYFQLKDMALRRMQAMLNYVKKSDECRQTQLLRYFDEIKNIECGVCDVCKREKESRESLQEVESLVLQLVDGKSWQVSELVGHLNMLGYSNIDDTLEDMMDRGLLSLDSNLYLTKGR